MRVIAQVLVGAVCIVVALTFRSLDQAQMSVQVYFLLVLVVGSIAGDAVMTLFRFTLKNFGTARSEDEKNIGRGTTKIRVLPRDVPDTTSSPRQYSPLVKTAVANNLAAAIVFLAASAILIRAVWYVGENHQRLPQLDKPWVAFAGLLALGLAPFLSIACGIYTAKTVTRLRVMLRGAKLPSKMEFETSFGWMSIWSGLAAFALSSYLSWSPILDL